MKILIISNTTWDNSNSFGNTFSNLFEGIKDIEIYNICCRNGKENNSIVKQAVQMTDASVLRSVYKTKYDPCWVMEKNDDNDKNIANQEISVSARKKRRTISFIIRDLIWKLGRWKKSKTLNEFLAKVKPDIAYLPIYASPYLCDVQKYIIDKINVPVVGHVSDDIYGYPYKCSGLAKIYRNKIRKKVKKIVNRCEYLEVFAENMQNEYSKIFNKQCYLVGKGLTTDNIQNIKIDVPFGEKISFVYTGNIADGRYEVLSKIGNMIGEVFGNEKAKLEIYSTTLLTDEMKKLFDACQNIVFHGAINKEDVATVQKNADYLVHVEGFSDQAVFSAKMSFSTKIIDYISMNKPIFAVGPKDVNSISVLEKENIAIVSTTEEEIRVNLQKILKGEIDFLEIEKNVIKYLTEKRDIIKIQQGIFNRLKETLKNESITD